jgi:hypothetical protein
VKDILKIKNLEVFGGLSQKVVQARQNLAIAQSKFLSSGGSIACQRKERESVYITSFQFRMQMRIFSNRNPEING